MGGSPGPRGARPEDEPEPPIQSSQSFSGWPALFPLEMGPAMVEEMGSDSSTLIASAVLFGAAAAAWWLSATLTANTRLYLRFATVLLAALAVANLFALSGIAALLLLPLAAAALALAALARFARPLGNFSAPLVLIASLAAGLCAMLADLEIVALIPVAVAGLVIVAAALHATALVALVSGLALFAAPLVYLEEGARAGMLLFLAAALFGLTRNRLARNHPARNKLVRSTKSERRGAAVP